MKTRYKILSFIILGIAFITSAFGGTYLFSSNPFLGYFDSDAIENLQEVKKFKELYPEATRGSVIDETGIRTVRFTYFEHDTSFVYDGPNKTPNNIVLEILFDSVTKSLLDAKLTCTFNDTIDISKTIVDSLSKDDCFESDYDKPTPGDKYYIEPERKAQLEAVELDLRNKIQQFHQKNPLSSFAVNLDHHTKEIIVIVENEQFNSEIEEMISQYPDDIPIVFSNGKIVVDDFSGWITDEDYCSEWCDQNELYSLGCDAPILQHLTKYSNLLDEEFDGVYGIEDIGLPDEVSQEKFEECVDFIYEKRTSIELENEN